MIRKYAKLTDLLLWDCKNLKKASFIYVGLLLRHKPRTIEHVLDFSLREFFRDNKYKSIILIKIINHNIV
jgi:hypothetical protein